MLTAAEALEKIFDAVSPLPEEQVSLRRAADRVLTRDLFAQDDLPSFDNSAMDGFAVRAQDVAGASKTNPVLLSVQEKIRAGVLSTGTVKPGHAMMIMTGACLPPGADAVVMKEATDYNGNGSVKIFYPTEVGDHIRPRGEDVRKGDLILTKGARIRPYEIALLAAQGFGEVPVHGAPRVAVVSTGDELLDVGSPLAPGKIRNSNGPALACAVERWGAQVNHVSRAKDDPGELEAALRAALAQADVTLVSGGVSVGDYDHTKATLETLGVREVFWKVAIKPGKPLYFGVFEENKYVFGLPGNPISALVCLEEFVRPALETLMGGAPRHPSYHLMGAAQNEYPLPAGRRHYLFCQAASVGAGFALRVLRPQGSAMMGMAVRANALAYAADGARKISIGDPLSFRWLK